MCARLGGKKRVVCVRAVCARPGGKVGDCGVRTSNIFIPVVVRVLSIYSMSVTGAWYHILYEYLYQVPRRRQIYRF